MWFFHLSEDLFFLLCLFWIKSSIDMYITFLYYSVLLFCVPKQFETWYVQQKCSSSSLVFYEMCFAHLISSIQKAFGLWTSGFSFSAELHLVAPVYVGFTCICVSGFFVSTITCHLLGDLLKCLPRLTTGNLGSVDLLSHCWWNFSKRKEVDFWTLTNIVSDEWMKFHASDVDIALLT